MGLDPYIGEIILFAGNYAPQGWAFCRGQLLPIYENQALYSILGTIYGGDGKTNFALPDLRGRVPIGFGQLDGNGTIYPAGQKGGAETVALNNNQLPSHSHVAKINEVSTTAEITLKASQANATETSPEGAVPAVINRPTGPGTISTQPGYIKSDPDVYMKPTEVRVTFNSVNVDVSNTGSSQPVENRQPFLGVNYIIALQGNYPVRQ